MLILKFAPSPFFWLGLVLAAGLFLAIFLVHGSWPRAILFNFGILACLLTAAEAFLLFHQITPTILPKGFYVDDDVLGWAPAKRMQAQAIEYAPSLLSHHPAKVVFDTKYSIDSNGLRIAPPYRNDLSLGTVLFFGCSFAFGEGLNDNETLPYQVGDQSGGQYRVFNFGFNAYSPAHMLAAIENGLVGRIVDENPKYAYYVALPHHVWRVAGRVAWIHHEPRYVLDANGTLHRVGFLEDHTPLAERLGLGRRFGLQLDKSAMWRTFDLHESNVSEEDIRLYLAMVRRSRELLAAQYPDIQFRIILWPGHGVVQRSTYEKLRSGFERMGIPLDLVEDILPGYKIDDMPYRLSSSNPHPNALADRLLAKYILSKTLR